MLRNRWVNALREQTRTKSRENIATIGGSRIPTHIPARRKCRKGLPLRFCTVSGTREIMTKYDTGTMANHISLDLAKELNYTIDGSPHLRAQFVMANGKLVTAVSHIAVNVAFSRSDHVDEMTCYFNVFKTLAFSALIGMAFLYATETFSNYASRLVDLPNEYMRSLRLCYVGEATNYVHCIINGRSVAAHADTGAEITLVNADFASRLSFIVSKTSNSLAVWQLHS